MVVKDQGDLPAARILLERALRIWDQTLGPEHPSTRTAHDNLASLTALEAQRNASQSVGGSTFGRWWRRFVEKTLRV